MVRAEGEQLALHRAFGAQPAHRPVVPRDGHPPQGPSAAAHRCVRRRGGRAHPPGGLFNLLLWAGGEHEWEMKVVGPGCAKCALLYREAVKAVAQSGLAVSLAKVEDIEGMMAYGIMMSPALVIDGRVVSAGRVPSAGEIAAMIASAATGARP